MQKRQAQGLRDGDTDPMLDDMSDDEWQAPEDPPELVEARRKLDQCLSDQGNGAYMPLKCLFAILWDQALCLHTLITQCWPEHVRKHGQSMRMAGRCCHMLMQAKQAYTSLPS